MSYHPEANSAALLPAAVCNNLQHMDLGGYNNFIRQQVMDFNIGIIGASRVAIYALIAPSQVVSDVCIRAVAARDISRAQVYAKQHGIARAFNKYALLISDPEVDLVYIGTPPHTHARLALDAIAAGKHVLVEKPFTMSVAEAWSVHEAGQAAGVQVFEAMHSPHHSLFKRVLEIINSGEIGAVKRLAASFNAPIEKDDPFRWDVTLGGGALMDLGIYPLAWVRRIAGEDFHVVQADAQLRNGVDVAFSATIRFANGIACDINSSMESEVAAARLQIEGDLGTMEVLNPIAPQLGHSLIITIDGHAREEIVAGPSTYEAQLMAVRDACLGQSTYPFPDSDYIDSMAAIAKIRAAF